MSPDILGRVFAQDIAARKTQYHRITRSDNFRNYIRISATINQYPPKIGKTSDVLGRVIGQDIAPRLNGYYGLKGALDNIFQLQVHSLITVAMTACAVIYAHIFTPPRPNTKV